MSETEITDLFDTYADMVYRLSYSYLRQPHEAEDATQAVFLKLIDGTAQPGVGKERAYLTQITVNHCKDLLRTVWRRRVTVLDETIDFAQKEDRELFLAVMELPDKYRLVVYLHYYEGYTFSEIGTFLKLGASTVSMRLHRARNLLKNRLQENFDE